MEEKRMEKHSVFMYIVHELFRRLRFPGVGAGDGGGGQNPIKNMLLSPTSSSESLKSGKLVM